MKIDENITLAPFTTFKIGGPADFFCSVATEADVREAVAFAQKKKIPFFVIGGGSNLLISDKGFPGLVILNEMKGIEIRSKEKGVRSKEDEDDDEIISAAAGESWDGFVEYTVSQGFSGLENLSSIPGTVGASAVQNLGAYGVTAGQLIYSVRAFDTREMKFVELSSADCGFEYRDSMFKHEKGRYIITGVDFKLEKGGKVNIEYKDLKEYFEKKKVVNNPPSIFHHLPSPREVREAVISIRAGKLPDWKLWGTAGSFFKNPVVSAEKYAALKEKYPGLPGFPESDGKVKLALAWILDNICHAKGMMNGNVGTYEKQALVFVAKPGATAAEVVELAQELMKMVKDATGVTIEGEVEWVN
jgi:UDP-N-acetylmuramate dehydrogenase